MSEKITESQIYLFLADYGNTWKEDADKLDKEDGKVSKYEFKQFLGSEMNGWNGVDISQLSHSVIDNFFAKIDTNSVGSSNFNILDSKELDDMEGNVRAYQMLSEFINEKYKNDFPTSTLDSKYGNSWKWELSDSLTSVIENAIAAKKTDETSLKSALNAAYPQAFSLATAQCCVAQYTDSSEIKSLMKGLDYSFENDKTFQTIIKNYIASLGEVTPGSDGAKDINEKIKSIVNDYLATASLGSGNPENVEELGYNKSKLNDLQKARLGQIASNALNGKLTTIDIKDRNGNKIDLTLAGYSELFQKATAEFVNWYTTSGYKSVSVTPGQDLFKAIEADLSANADKLFETSSAFANFKKEVQMTDSYILLDENKNFYNKLKDAGLNEDQLTKIKEQNLPEYKNAYNEILKEILNGNSTYLNSDGSINFNTVDSKLIEILRVKLGIVKTTTDPTEPTKTIDGWDGTSNVVMPVGTTKLFQASAILDAKIDPSKVTYNVTSANGGKISMINSATGKFNYTTPTNAGFDTITIGCYYNGELLGTKTITIKVSEIGKWGTDNSQGNLEIYGLGAPSDGTQVSAADFASLYNNDAVIQLFCRNKNGRDDDTTKKRLGYLVDMIVNALGEGLDATKLKQAAEIVKTRYQNNLITYPGASSTNLNDFRNILISGAQNDKPSGILCNSGHKSGHRTRACSMVSFRQLVDDILAEYNKL